MERIEKKHVKRMNCPKCHAPKLRSEPAAMGGGAATHKVRCDVCKIQFLEGDPAIQAELKLVAGKGGPARIHTHH